MARSSLTDQEVAIIKNLINRGEANKVIAGLINRSRGNADTDISPGRISNIKNNEIQKYVPIKAASDQAIDVFLQTAQNADQKLKKEVDPLSDDVLKNILPLKSSNPLVFNITETDVIECKESFNLITKTIAAFANNKGGYFISGVKDKTWEVLGLSNEKYKKFEEFDLKDHNQKIMKSLGVDLQIQKRGWEINGKKLGITYVAPARIKPVILISGDGDTNQGQIYYRYSGEDRLITGSDLQRLIEDRLRQLSESVLLKHISNILKFGIGNAAILNTVTGEVSGKGGNFLIDESLISQLNFIHEGKFVEKDGAPAFRLIGNVQAVNNVTVVGGVTALNDDIVMQDFIDQKKVSNPQEYIKHLKNTQVTWLPIYYFIKQAGIETKQAIKLLEDGVGKKSKIKDQKQRLVGKKNPKTSGKKESYAAEIKLMANQASLKGIPQKSLPRYFQAILHLDKGEIEINYALGLLKDNYQSMYEKGGQNEQSLFRAAASKIDEIFFRN